MNNSLESEFPNLTESFAKNAVVAFQTLLDAKKEEISIFTKKLLQATPSADEYDQLVYVVLHDCDKVPKDEMISVIKAKFSQPINLENGKTMRLIEMESRWTGKFDIVFQLQ